ncbi:MAG: hypothetical protein KA716_32070 [Gloeotrichia echinulata DEX184]|jgi:hypothetical protein|nr:hypothetical protein [Gloeotrichia echinulata DEX184]
MGLPQLSDATAGLYNTVCQGLNLSNKQFQLIQGVLPVQTRSQDLYNYFNAIPAETVAILYVGTPFNTLSGNYEVLFDEAKNSRIKTKAETDFDNSAYWVGGQPGVNPRYAPPFEDLSTLVGRGGYATIKYDSLSANTNISDSWARTTSGAGVGFWGTTSSSVSEELNKKASSSRITVDITLNKFAYLAIQPEGWFRSGFFTYQYQNVQQWVGGQAQWDKYFGEKGTCTRLSFQALVVDGYDYTVTSYANYSSEEFQKIQNNQSTNVWPFYTSSRQSTATQSHSFNDDKSITTRVVCKAGSLQIFGIGVIPTKVAMIGNAARIQESNLSNVDDLILATLSSRVI